MKTKWFKRIASCLLAISMIFATTNMALAAEVSTESEETMKSNVVVIPASLDDTDTIIMDYTLNVEDSGEITISDDNTGVNPKNNILLYREVPACGTVDCYPQLESYVGFNQNFIVNSTSDSTTGFLAIYLYNPSGKLVSDQWEMGVNETVKWSVFLPSSGQWHLRIVGYLTNAPAYVFAGWEPK